MSNDSKRVSELTVTTTLSANDRVVALAGVDSSPDAKTITLRNLGRALTVNSIPIANSSQLGIIKIGDGLAIAANGLVTAPLPIASNTVTGVVKIGDGIDVDEDGLISIGFNSGTYNITEVTTATYYVSNTDSVIFADPYSIGEDITIILPIGEAVEGREITVKCLRASGFKIIVATTGGIGYGQALLENPITGLFNVDYELISRGEGETWIHNGEIWRHIATQHSAPIFYTEDDTYHQVVVQNNSDGHDASGDFVVYNNIGNYKFGTGPFIDMGINSNNYSNSVYSIGNGNDAYIFTDSAGYPGGNLAIGTASDASIIFHANGTTSDKKIMVINSTSIDSTIEQGSAFTTVIQTKNSWEVYPDDNDQNGWAWIKAELPDANTPQVFIENKIGGNGPTYRWTFDNIGGLSVPGTININGQGGIGWYDPATIPGQGNLNLAYNMILGSANGVILAAGESIKAWNFDKNGNLTLPADGIIFDSLLRPLLNPNALDINADGGTSTSVFAIRDEVFTGGGSTTVFGRYEAALDGGVSFNNRHSASYIDGGGANVL